MIKKTQFVNIGFRGKIGFPYGRVVSTPDGKYEIHWYTTVTGEEKQEVCEKCGEVYYNNPQCLCDKSTAYRCVNTIAEAEEILSKKPVFGKIEKKQRNA